MDLHNKRVLNVREAAQYLGFAVSYIYRLTCTGKIPFSKPNGKTVWFDREKLDEWMLSAPNKTQDQQEAEASTYISTHQSQA